MLVLGIETSCDDTSLCLLEVKNLPHNKKIYTEILTLTSNQDDVLNYWGGVVPEISARNHQDKLPFLMNQIFEKAKVDFQQIDLIGVTHRPGLIGPLMTGVNFAKAFSLLYEKPIYPVHHLLAHLQAVFLNPSTTPQYPYLGVLVSGGNGFLSIVKDSQDWEIIGFGLDDAPGEAFDKGGRMLQLGYPAGRIIDQLAKKGDPNFFPFPIGMKNNTSCDMSFSGVKTALRYYLEKNPPKEMSKSHLENICASYQHAIVMGIIESIKKSRKLLNDKYHLNLDSLDIVIGGGVAANSYLREKISLVFPKSFFVEPKYCTDNATMVAHLAGLNHDKGLPYPDCLSFEVFSSCL